jgi:VWFA-related protein
VYRFLRFLFVLLPLCAVLGQDAAPPQLQPRPAEADRISSNGPDRRVTLDVQVTDKSGAPVRGLQQQDFTVLDDKQPQKILSFHAVDSAAAATAELPMEIVLVVDAVNAPFQAVANERNELRKFLLQNGGKLPQPMSLIIFSDAGAEIQEGSTRDGNALAALLDKYETGLRTVGRSQGFYGAAERFNLSLKTIAQLAEYERPRPGRKLVIWISPGWPLLTGPNTELSSKDQQRLFDDIVADSTKLRQARVTLYTVDPLGLADFQRTVYYEEYLKGVTSASRATAANLALPVLAVQTGGRVLSLTNDLANAIAECAADADVFYVLSFDGARADRANEYHALVIKIDKPGTKARARTGYYAQP